ncbi:MAG: acyl-CoA dehydrogenase family protein [Thermodesulfobacteriota bacterium]
MASEHKADPGRQWETEEHRLFRQSFRRFVAQEITPKVRQWEAEGMVPRDLWLKMGREGFLCPWLPPEYGGLNLGYEFSVIISEELIRGDAFGLGVSLHSDVAVPYIFRYASDEVKARWLPGCAAGEVITALALTEPGAGSDLSALRTRAARAGDQYRLDGQKTFISNGCLADLIIVAARTEPQAGFWGLSLILVAGGAPGLSRGRPLKKMGCHLQDTAELFFEDCRTPLDYLLGQEGLGHKYLLERLPEERLEVAIKCQAMAEEALREALSYARTRQAFGRPIGNFQHNAFKLAEMATEVELGRVFLERLLDDHLSGRDIALRVSMAKYWLAEMVNRVAYQAVQIHGGYGYMEEYRACRIYRDVRVLSIYAGTSEIMKMLISRRLGLRPS